MAFLNQIIAIEKGIKSRVYSVLTDLNKVVQKADLFTGFSKTYQPKDEEGEQLPPEKKEVQHQTSDVLQKIEENLTELMYVTARKDWTNCLARADIRCEGILLKDVPVTYMLFLEKQLTDLRTFIGNLPLLDKSDVWEYDELSRQYRTNPVQTIRTKKIQRPLVLYPATEKHPAQVQMVTEDITVGIWNTVKFSGAISKQDKESILEKIEKLLETVKQAREQANLTTESTVPEIGKQIFSYLLGD